jgi:two-component system NtrC family sensor kinase
MHLATPADYRTMIEAAPEAIIVYTPEKFLFLNGFAAHRLGSNPETLVGQPIMDYVHPDSIPAVIARIRQLAETGEAGPPLDVRFVSKDGNVIPAEIISVPIVFAGQKALLGLIRDITKRAEVEEERANAQRRAGIAETTIAVAHEMNNVLTVLTMNAELLAHDASPEEMPGIASEILSASNRIAATVQRLRQLGDQKSVDYLGEKRMLDLSSSPTPQRPSKKRTRNRK